MLPNVQLHLYVKPNKSRWHCDTDLEVIKKGNLYNADRMDYKRQDVTIESPGTCRIKFNKKSLLENYSF